MPRSSEKLEHAISQLLIAHGYMEHSFLEECIEGIRDEFAPTDALLEDMFASINDNLRPLSMEVKTVSLSSDNSGERVKYHGIVNTEEDTVSKLHGSQFSAEELAAFVAIVNKLLERKYLSSDDILSAVAKNINKQKLAVILNKLRSKGWLDNDDTNYWILGVRTYLELKPYLESVLMNLGDDADELDREEAQQLVNALPQLIVYGGV